MTVTLSPQTEELLQKMARLWDWDAEELGDALLVKALEAADRTGPITQAEAREMEGE